MHLLPAPQTPTYYPFFQTHHANSRKRRERNPTVSQKHQNHHGITALNYGQESTLLTTRHTQLTRLSQTRHTNGPISPCIGFPHTGLMVTQTCQGSTIKTCPPHASQSHPLPEVKVSTPKCDTCFGLVNWGGGGKK
jgi:hypothetical protein